MTNDYARATILIPSWYALIQHRSGLLTSMSRRVVTKYGRVLIWLAVGAAGLFLIVATWFDHGGVADFGALVLNLILLLITATTLHLTIPDRAHLWLDRQTELGFDDLLFFIEGDSGQGIPRDMLLQLHVAASNVGGRKAVLSRVELITLLDGDGNTVDLGFGPATGTKYTTHDRWVIGFAVFEGQQNTLERSNIRDELPGPFTLAPDDVITLRLRDRQGIDWSDRWSLEALQMLANALERPIERARIAATYRRGDELVTENFEVPLVPKQQALYLEALRFVTNDLTLRPQISPRPIRDL